MKNLFVCLLAFGCDAGPSGPCAAVSGSCVSFAKTATETEVQTAFGRAKANTTFLFAAGTFSFSNELTVNTDNVTIKGAGMDQTIFDFTNQTAGAEGLLALNNGFTITDVTVQNSKGNGVKVVGATGATFQRVHVRWTDPDPKKHGPYALYPVQSTNVLVEDCLIEGAADAGIYVGQSEQIVVRRNTAVGNVAGIEIENSHFADVYENEAHDNTAGILVFALPDSSLQVLDCHHVRLHDNNIHDNNTENFAETGSTVAIVPRGTGTFIMSASQVEVFGNKFINNKNANFAVISYMASGMPPNVAGYKPYSVEVYTHDNTFMGGGDAPDTTMAYPSIGGFLQVSMARFPGMKVGDMVYDGLVDQMRTGTRPGNPMDLCFDDSGTFLNLHFDQLDTTDGFVAADDDRAPFACTLPPIDAVSFPGLK